MMIPTAFDLLCEIRNVDGLRNHFEAFGTDSRNPLVAAVAQLAYEEGRQLRLSIEPEELD